MTDGATSERRTKWGDNGDRISHGITKIRSLSETRGGGDHTEMREGQK